MKNKSRPVLLGLLGVAIVGASGYFSYQLYDTKRSADVQAATARLAAQQAKQLAEAQRVAQAEMLRSITDAGPSRWLEDGLTPLWSALTKSNVRVLIVPPGNIEDKPGLDVTARVAFARQLAGVVAQPEGSVPDPGFVYTAIGEPRTIDETRLLRRLHATRIETLVTGSLAVESGHVALRLQRTDLPKMQRRSYDVTVNVVAADRPEQSLLRVALEAARALGFDAKPRDQRHITTAPALALPASPLAAVEPPPDPLTGIWLQQLLAVFHSPLFLADPRSQERLFERSLWSLSSITEDSPDYLVLEARALAYLGRRQAALRTLQDAPRTPESEELRAYLNADLPALKKAVAGVRRPVARLIAQLELMPVQAAADDQDSGSRRAEAERIAAAVPEAWQALIALYALSFDPWDYPDPIAVKGVLERDFPVADYRTQELLRGRGALGTTAYDPKLLAELALSPLVHVRKWREQHVDQLCCRAATSGNGPLLVDYLDLLENSADALMLGHLFFLRVIQGNRDDALNTMRIYDELQFHGGHPGVLLQKGSSFVRTTEQPESAWNDEEVFEAARKIKTWVGYQSAASAWGLRNWRAWVSPPAAVRGHRGSYELLHRPVELQPLATDLPPRDAFLVELSRGIVEFETRRPKKKAILYKACTIAIYNFAACEGYAQLVEMDAQGDERKQADELLRGRFTGYADATFMKAANLRYDGRSEEAKSLLREALKSTAAEELFTELGEILADEGQFDEAVKVFSSLPDLRRPPDNTVRLSQYLYHAAQLLLARGGAAQARRLVETASSYGDGSQPNLEMGVQLALWNNDGELALQRLQSIYQRYPNEVTLGEIASLMFALGDNQAAWGVLKSGTSNDHTLPAFEAAVIGLRREQSSPPGVLAWADSVGRTPYMWTSTMAFQLFALDRNGENIERFWQVEPSLRASDARDYSHGVVSGRMLSTTADGNAMALRATVEGYRKLLQEDYASAAREFAPILDQFDKTGVPNGFEGPDNLWCVVPYAAYALARSGHPDEAAALLERFDERHQRAVGRQNVMVKSAPEFESHLVNAITAALRKDHVRAMDELRRAQGQVDDRGRARLIPKPYAFAEIAEWLSRDTGNAAYVGVGVDFARSLELYEPWTAWSYAYEAAHAKGMQSRIRAAGIAMWLDPDSRRLHTLQAGLAASAKRWLEQHHSPLRKATGNKPQTKA